MKTHRRDLRLRQRAPAGTVCPYCHDGLRSADPVRTCLACGAPYHTPCGDELGSCGILACDGALSRAEAWSPAEVGLSERIRRALRQGGAAFDPAAELDVHAGPAPPVTDPDWRPRRRRRRLTSPIAVLDAGSWAAHILLVAVGLATVLAAVQIQANEQAGALEAAAIGLAIVLGSIASALVRLAR